MTLNVHGHTQDSEQEKEQRYWAIYYVYLAVGGWLSYTPSVEHIVGWTTCCLSVLVLFRLRHAYVEKIPGSPRDTYSHSGGAWEWGYWEHGTVTTDPVPLKQKWRGQEMTSYIGFEGEMWEACLAGLHGHRQTECPEGSHQLLVELGAKSTAHLCTHMSQVA